ncbi:hypothetical protein MASR2M17_17320 [Aminivibrio sp.]
MRPDRMVLTVMVAAACSVSIPKTWENERPSASGMAGDEDYGLKDHGLTGQRVRSIHVRAEEEAQGRILPHRANIFVSPSSFRDAPRREGAMPLAMFLSSLRVS